MSKWLLIEDEPDLYELLSHIYDRFNAEVIAYTTGEDALAWLDTIPANESQESDRLPVFALIDIRLPGQVDGIQVAEHLHSHPALKDVSIVVMTAYRLSPSEEYAVMQRTGAKRLLYKPLPAFNELHRIFLELT